MGRSRWFWLWVMALAQGAAWSAGVVVSSSAVNVPEGGTNTFTVRLDAAPVAEVTLGVGRVSGDADISVGSPARTWTVLSGEAKGSFDEPRDLAVGAGDVIYIADACNQRIQVRSPDGTYAVWGSCGDAPGQFRSPSGVAVDAAGNIYVADTGNNRIQKRDTSGAWETWGGFGHVAGRFYSPLAVAVDGAGNVYVADTLNNCIQKRGTDGTWTAWGSGGTDVGQFSFPSGIAADAAGNIYVADRSNDRVQRRNPDGTWTVLGTQGSGPGQFRTPMGLEIDDAGTLYVAESNGHRAQKRLANGTWVVYPNNATSSESIGLPYGVAVNAAGEILLSCVVTDCIWRQAAGGGWTRLTGYDRDAGHFYYPRGVAVDKAGTIYVADMGHHRIQKRSVDGTWVTAGSYGVDAGKFASPKGVAVDATGLVYVADTSNDRIQVGSFAGGWSVWGGTGSTPGLFSDPRGVCVDAVGNVYVADSGNNRIQKRSTGGLWSVLAAAGTAVGQMQSPSAVALDSAGNLYVADSGNDRVQMRDAGGTWTAWGSSGSAVGQFHDPRGLAVDAAGCIYVAESGRVQMLDASGTWSVLGVYGWATGQFSEPQGVCVDAAGCVYLTDCMTNRIQKLCPSLTFTSSNWSAPRTVTLKAAEDPDTVNGVATIRCDAGGWAEGFITGAAVTATEIDSGLKDILTTVNAVTVPEAGTATFGVKLSKAPTANVSVSVSRTSGDNNLSVTAGATLTFTTANWNTAQTVTVGATDDADAVNGVATISASASGWAAASVTATEADNDLRLVVSPSAVSVPEGGSATYGVSLAGQPGGEVKVGTVRQSGDTSLTISAGAALTFTAANWSVPQTVRVAAASDADTANGSATLVSSATGWATASVTATEADDDMRIVATPTSLSVPEGGTATYALVLAGPPAANVTVSTARLSGDTDLTVDLGASLTFTTSNWNVPKTVRLRGASDADAASGSALFRASAAGWSSADVTATELDDEMRIVAAPTSVSLAEGGTATFAVSLGGAPASSVVVRTTRLSGDPSLAVDLGAALTFTSANWSVPQTVRLRASDDADAISGTAVMQAAAAGWASANVTATAADNDLRILATPTSLTVPEAGAGTYAITLAGAPASSVTVSTARIGGDSSLAVAAGAALTFTASNWNLPQTARIAAAADSDMANGVALFQSSATGWTSVTVTATEADDDKRLVVSTNAVTVPENGSVTYSLRLGAKPPSNVTVTTSRSGGDSSVSVDLGAQLTFTPANWNVMQTVRLRAADDVDAIGSKATLRSSASGWAAASVTATEADDDLRIVVSATAVAVPEGGTATYKVRLAGQPSASVTVKVARVAGDSNVSVDLGAALTFTPSNWKAGQTVRLRAAADTDALNGIATIRASSSGWLSAEVRATEIDTRSASETVPIDPCDEPWPLSPRDAWSRLGVRGAAPVCIAFRQLWYE